MCVCVCVCVCVLLIHCHTRCTKIRQIILQSRNLAEDVSGVAKFQDSSCKSFSTMTLKMCGHETGLLHLKNNDT